MQKKSNIYLEYACLDYTLSELELESNIVNAVKYGIENICVPYYSLSTLKNISLLENNNINISCPVDYGYGMSDIKSRNLMVNQIATFNINIKNIDVFIPSKIIANRKYDKFRDDIKSNIDSCAEKQIQIRYILEYRRYSHDILAKVCQILKTFNIDYIFPSSGIMIDDINDNLIACNFLSEKSKIKPIITGNIYNSHHVSIVKNYKNLYGIRFFNLNSLFMFMK